MDKNEKIDFSTLATKARFCSILPAVALNNWCTEGNKPFNEQSTFMCYSASLLSDIIARFFI